MKSAQTTIFIKRCISTEKVFVTRHVEHVLLRNEPEGVGRVCFLLRNDRKSYRHQPEIKEENFITRNHATEGDFVTVRLTVPVKETAVTDAEAEARRKADRTDNQFGFHTVGTDLRRGKVLGFTAQ
mgnify:CR=1 FL=1